MTDMSKRPPELVLRKRFVGRTKTELSLVDQQHVGSVMKGGVQVVGNHDDRRSLFDLKPFEHLLQVGRSPGVDTRRGFIQEYQFRASDERPGQIDALELAPG